MSRKKAIFTKPHKLGRAGMFIQRMPSISREARMNIISLEPNKIVEEIAGEYIRKQMRPHGEG